MDAPVPRRRHRQSADLPELAENDRSPRNRAKPFSMAHGSSRTWAISTDFAISAKIIVDFTVAMFHGECAGRQHEQNRPLWRRQIIERAVAACLARQRWRRRFDSGQMKLLGSHHDGPARPGGSDADGAGDRAGMTGAGANRSCGKAAGQHLGERA